MSATDRANLWGLRQRGRMPAGPTAHVKAAFPGSEAGQVSARYSLVFLVLGVASAATAAAAREGDGAAAVAFLYLAFSFLLLSAAYAGLGPRLFLKRADGCLRPWTWLLFGPYLLLNALTFRLYRLGNREPAHGEAAPHLHFGRRLTPAEVRRAQALGWQSVLDLAPEFSEVAGLRAVPRYRSLPILDGTAPTAEQLRAAVDWLAESVARGPVYVHCAGARPHGHGGPGLPAGHRANCQRPGGAGASADAAARGRAEPAAGQPGAQPGAEQGANMTTEIVAANRVHRPLGNRLVGLLAAR